MKYLFVIPRGVSKAQCFNIFPIGIAYVSASLKQAGHSVLTINLEFHPEGAFAALKPIILDHHIDVICTGGLSYDCSKVRDVIDAARAINPDVAIIVGGGIISSDPIPAMRVLGADIGIIGEGEVTMCELAHALDNGLPYDNIPGLILKNDVGNSHVITKRRPEILDLDSVTFPDHDGFNYLEWTRMSGTGIIVGSRSCTHNCTFCFHTSGNKYRQRSLDNIFKEIAYQVERYDVRTISMSDELFASDKHRVYAFCENIRKYNISWSVALRVCDVDADLLRLMKASGCVQVSYGLESADNSVLKSMKKMITVEQIKNALEETYDAGMNVTGGFIFGDINEDRTTAANTLNFWYENNRQHYMNVTMIIVFPGSALYKHACNTGIIKDKEQFLRDGCPLINVSKLTDAEYKNLTSLIFELRLHPHVPAESFDIKAIESNGQCEIEFTCRKCGVRNHSNVWFWFGKEIWCPSCGLINFVDPFQNSLNLEDAFAVNLPTDQDIVLWGAGGIYYKLIHKYFMLSSKRFLLVDGNRSLQGLTICEKEVLSPDVIGQRNVKTVVITALSAKEEIYATLRSSYPSVERILIPAFNITKDGIVPVLQPMND
jgi:anaerobic magnesium-protoporphyrin IX monomethyl ester cyclase